MRGGEGNAATMALISWNDKMSVGVAAIDADHQHLMRLLNRLHTTARKEKDPDTVRAVLDELIRYADYHFQAEEQLMRLGRYPDYEKHKKRHEELQAEVVALRERFDDDPTSVHAFRIFTFLSDWLMRHILREDMKYKPYLQRNGSNGTASS